MWRRDLLFFELLIAVTDGDRGGGEVLGVVAVAGEGEAVFAAVGVVEEEGVVLEAVGSAAGLLGDGRGEVGFDAHEVEGAVVVEMAIGGEGEGGDFSAVFGKNVGAVEACAIDGGKAD